MFIKEIVLHNIRSYQDQKIEFSSGITLLSGDIGSGKTTILLALEFALFGLLRGKVSGSELLRHGEKHGWVTLKFSVGEKEVEITRSLRKTATSVTQSPGELSLNGLKEDLVPTELKAKILQLLGYPETFLATSTNLFRYTVYTPQEQVKLILYEPADQRKDIIRKIFRMDKYQTIKDNLSPYVLELKNRSERLLGQADDLAELENQKKVLNDQVEELKKQLPLLEKKVSEEEKNVAFLRKEKQVLDEKNKARVELEHQKKLLLQQQQSLSSQLQKIEKRITDFQSLPEIKVVEFEKEHLLALEEKQELITEKKNKLLVKLGQIQDTILSLDKESISVSGTCPTCKQEISQEHLSTHRTHLDEKKKTLLSKQQQYKEVLATVKEKEQSVQLKLKYLRENQRAYAVYLEKKNVRALQLQEQKQLLKDKEDLRSQQKEQSLQQEKLEEQLTNTPLLDTSSIQQSIQLQENILREEERKKTQTQTSLSYTQKQYDTLLETIKKKTNLQTQAHSLKQTRHWIKELLFPLLHSVEQKVLYQVFYQFQEYFSTWFSLLVNDDELVATLDQDFGVRLEQQGFDTSLENLSGGEKTAVALAYRLALHKVVNDYFSTLHTKGLLILDEPTDGFSTEQIDTLQEVFRIVGSKQLILVSHEVRLESLADTVIRVQKQHHTSLIRYL